MRAKLIVSALWMVAVHATNCGADQVFTNVPVSPDLARQLRSQLFELGNVGAALNLSQYHVTFEDEFNTMSVTTDKGHGPWYSPVHSSFGGSQFRGPSKNGGPVFVRNGNLIIQLYRRGPKWISSNVQTVNSKGQGFAQKYGYFEMRAKFSPGMGGWYAFWLHSHPKFTGMQARQTEIDIVEAYGGSPSGLHTAVHLWPSWVPNGPDSQLKWGQGRIERVAGMFVDYHTYGVDISPEWITFYYDRKELSRIPTLPDMKTPQYILMDLALLEKQAALAPKLLEMQIDYVRVWQRNSLSTQ